MIARNTPVSFLPFLVHTYSSSSEDCICFVRCEFVYLLFLFTVKVRSHRDSECPSWLSACLRYLPNLRIFWSFTLDRFSSWSFFYSLLFSSFSVLTRFYAWFAVLWYSWCPYFYAVVIRPTHVYGPRCVFSRFFTHQFVYRTYVCPLSHRLMQWHWMVVHSCGWLTALHTTLPHIFR